MKVFITVLLAFVASQSAYGQVIGLKKGTVEAAQAAMHASNREAEVPFASIVGEPIKKSTHVEVTVRGKFFAANASLQNSIMARVYREAAQGNKKFALPMKVLADGKDGRIVAIGEYRPKSGLKLRPNYLQLVGPIPADKPAEAAKKDPLVGMNEAERIVYMAKLKIAQDAIKQYKIVSKEGSATDAYVQAGLVTQAYLQLQDEENYTVWKKIQRAEAARAGIPEPK